MERQFLVNVVSEIVSVVNANCETNEEVEQVQKALADQLKLFKSIPVNSD